MTFAVAPLPLVFRRTALGCAVVAALALAGCAAPTTYSADVASFGQWPSGRSAGSYAFERLPSQAVRADLQQQLEDAARPALERAGFSAAAGTDKPDVVVQLGARLSRAETAPWDDPLWWRGGIGWRHGPWPGRAGWRGSYALSGANPWGYPSAVDYRRYEREVALLIRDRVGGAPLYEARASSEGPQSNLMAQLRPLFAAALQEFPNTSAAPHAVTVMLAAP